MSDAAELSAEQLAVIRAVRASMVFEGHALSEEFALANGREFFALGLDEAARAHARHWRPEGGQKPSPGFRSPSPS